MKTLCAGLCLLTLAACSNGPHVFGDNEVPPDVMAEPRVVETPVPGAAEKQSWMRLGDVPSMPRDFTPQPMIEQTRLQMIKERDQADAMQQAVENPPAPQP